MVTSSGKEEEEEEEEEVDGQAMRVDDFLGVFATFAASVLLSAMLLAAEVTWDKRRRRRRRRTVPTVKMEQIKYRVSPRKSPHHHTSRTKVDCARMDRQFI